MVTYGPWQEPVVYTEAWRYTNDGAHLSVSEWTIDPIPTFMGEPLALGDWRNVGSLGPGRCGRVYGNGYVKQQYIPEATPVYMDPDYGTEIPSQNAWAAAVENPYSEYEASTPIQIEYAGGISDPPGPGLIHEEAWLAESVELMPAFTPKPSFPVRPFLGIGSYAGDPSGAISVMVDSARNTSALFAETLSFALDFNLGAADSRWQVQVKDFGINASGWWLASEERVVTTGRAGPYLGSVGHFEFDPSSVETWRALADPIFGYDAESGGLPGVAIVWTGGWPENILGSEPPTYPVNAPNLIFTHQWRTPRWRWVYGGELSPPIRRTFPRDDGLAGGAGRTWPPPSSQQSSNRTVGGYL